MDRPRLTPVVVEFLDGSAIRQDAEEGFPRLTAASVETARVTLANEIVALEGMIHAIALQLDAIWDVVQNSL